MSAHGCHACRAARRAHHSTHRLDRKVQSERERSATQPVRHDLPQPLQTEVAFNRFSPINDKTQGLDCTPMCLFCRHRFYANIEPKIRQDSQNSVRALHIASAVPLHICGISLPSSTPKATLHVAKHMLIFAARFSVQQSGDSGVCGSTGTTSRLL